MTKKAIWWSSLALSIIAICLAGVLTAQAGEGHETVKQTELHDTRK